MKSTEVDESLSTTSTDVLFHRIPTNFKFYQQNEKSTSSDSLCLTPMEATYGCDKTGQDELIAPCKFSPKHINNPTYGI